MKSLSAIFVILFYLAPHAMGANEIPARSSLCKMTRATGLKTTDQALVLPEVKLTKEELSRVTRERTCLKGYGIGYPGGAEALMKASSSEIKADLIHFAGLFDKARTITLRPTQLQAVMTELVSQKDNEVHKLNATNRDTMRIHDIQKGLSREQALLWGNNLYLHRLYGEGDYKKLLQEVASLRAQFAIRIVPVKRLDEAEMVSYFSIQT